MSQMLKSNIEDVRYNIKEAAQRVGRNPDDIRLIAVTKTVQMNIIKEAYNYGLMELGENRVQELMAKFDELPEAKWHLIGHLQRNKVKYIIDKVTMIHSLDSIRLADEINQKVAKQPIDVLVQVNVAEEVTKYGIELFETEDFITAVKDMPNIRVKGLMTIAPYMDNPEEVRPVFRQLKSKFDAIKAMDIPGVEMEHLSMGMSNDYIIAVEEGATMLRIGSSLFGKRR